MSELILLGWRRYLDKLEKEPIKTKALTSAAMAAAADILAQRLSQRSVLNWRRTLMIALYGMIWAGPSNHVWQNLLEGWFPRRRDALRPVKKVIVDQLSYGPLNNVLFMLWVSTVIEGRSWKATRAKVRADYPAVQAKGWRLWPLASLVNQTVIPLELRVLWTNAVALVWSTFLITRARTATTHDVKWHRLPVLKPHTG